MAKLRGPPARSVDRSSVLVAFLGLAREALRMHVASQMGCDTWSPLAARETTWVGEAVSTWGALMYCTQVKHLSLLSKVHLHCHLAH